MAISHMPPSQQPLTLGRIDQLLEDKNMLMPSEEDFLRKKRAELVALAEWKEPKKDVGRPPNHIMKYFKYEHLKEGNMKQTSKYICELAEQMNILIPDGPEKTVGLRKLLEAKDCLVRAAME